MEAFDNLDELFTKLLSTSEPRTVKQVVKGSNEDDAVASLRDHAVVEFCDGSKKNFFLKVMRADSGAEQFENELHIYEREICMYTKVLPMLNEYEVNKEDVEVISTSTVDNLFPTFYGCGLIKGDLILVFEDILTNTGAFVTGKDEFHTNDQVNICLKHLGAFHAFSFALKLDRKISFLNDFPLLKDVLFLPEKKAFMEKNFDLIGAFKKQLEINSAVLGELRRENPLIQRKLKATCTEDDIARLMNTTNYLYDFYHEELFTPAEPLSVIIHGDFHMWNVAFDGHSQAVKFFDLQVSRYASPMIDVHHYLAQTTTAETRRKHLDGFLAA